MKPMTRNSPMKPVTRNIPMKPMMRNSKIADLCSKCKYPCTPYMEYNRSLSAVLRTWRRDGEKTIETYLTWARYLPY
jgi:hypothetical protein